MSEQRRVSTPESGHGGKRPREQATPGGGIKQERRGQEQVEASQGGEGVGAVVTVQTMEELEMNIRIPVARLHCHACLLPFKPPTFKCEAGHVVCSTCRDGHGQACAHATIYTSCVELDDIVRDAKVPCAYSEYGCTSWVVYHEVADHHRSCRCGPCFCPGSDCELFTSPARLAEHPPCLARHQDRLREAEQARRPGAAGRAGPGGRDRRVRVPGVRVRVRRGHGRIAGVREDERRRGRGGAPVPLQALGGGRQQQGEPGAGHVHGGQQRPVRRVRGGQPGHVPGGAAGAAARQLRRGANPQCPHRQGHRSCCRCRCRCQVPVRHSAVEVHQEAVVMGNRRLGSRLIGFSSAFHLLRVHWQLEFQYGGMDVYTLNTLSDVSNHGLST